MIRVFDFYADCGHGWLKVPKQLLKDMMIFSKITPYSYHKGNYAYLEEDCDASLFFNRYIELYGIEPKTRYHQSEHSKIRNYAHFD